MNTNLAEITGAELMCHIVNYFLVPLFSVLIFSKRHQEPVRMSAAFFVRYAVFTVCNALITNLGILFVRFFFHREIFQASARYTIAALLVAIVLPYLWDILSAAFSHVSFHVEPRG